MDNRIGNFTNHILAQSRRFFEEDWRNYGSKILMTTPEGFPKYQGFMLVGTNPRTTLRFVEVAGVLLDNRVYAETLMKKFGILEENPEYIASIQGRNPDKGLWGGAVRSSECGYFLYGGSGLPELVDNLILACGMHKYDMLDDEDLEIAVHYINPYIKDACNDIGMSGDNYARLRERIELFD